MSPRRGRWWNPFAPPSDDRAGGPEHHQGPVGHAAEHAQATSRPRSGNGMPQGAHRHTPKTLTSGSVQPPINDAWRWLRARSWFRRTTVVSVVAGAVLLLGAALWVFLGSPWLVANQVVVSGISGNDKRLVAGIGERQLHQPLLKVDTSGVKEEILHAGTFASVSVDRDWPDTVAISVQRRRPVVTLKDPQGALSLVDSEGVRFGVVTKSPVGVPEVTLSSPEDGDSLRSAINSVNAIPAAQRRDLTTVDATVRERLVMRIGTTEVVWGDSSRSVDKAKVLAALLGQGKMSRIDLSSPDRPVTVG